MCVLKRFLLVFIAVFYLLVSDVFAQEQSVEQIVKKYEQLASKQQAIDAINQQLSQFSTTTNLTVKDKVLLLLAKARFYFSLKDFDNGINVIKQAIALTEKNNLGQQQSDANKLLGIFYYYQGENHKALQAYQQSLNYYQNNLLNVKRAHLFNNIGLVYSSLGDYSQALQTYLLAQPIYEKSGSPIDQIDIRYNIAGLYVHLKRYDIAIEMFLEVIERRKQLKDNDGKYMAYADIGISYMHSGQLQLALHYETEALAYFQSQNDQYNVGSQMHNLSRLHIQMGQFEQAKMFAEKGIVITQKVGHQKAYAGVLQSLAEIYFQQSQFDQALVQLELSSEVAKRIKYQPLFNSNLELFALIYAAKNNIDLALKTHHEYIRQRNKHPNEMLNVKLARFESELSEKSTSKQLIEQVEQLQENKKLQQLQLAKEVQQRNFIVIASILFLMVGFFIYRRNIEIRSKQKLEVTVKKRTEELEFIMQELQNANTVKSQFLANMSHEMRTPLTAVIGQSEAIINDDVSQENIAKEVEIILNNSKHLLHLINDILDLSKIEANKLELELKQQDLHFIITELTDMFSEQANKKGIAFDVSHSLPIPFMLNVDGLRLKQILINFCSNAIKFTNKGKINIDIVLLGSELIFTVSDTGIGMSTEQMKQIFNSFTQGDSSISRRFGGSGLGLFLSEQIALVMGGTIDVESRPNHGSIFTLYLPFSSPTEIDSYSEDQVSVEQEQLVNLYQGQILLAEDHHDNRRLIARLLSGLGLDVLTAKNGLEAIELCQKNNPLMILMDIQMPEMDGVEAFKTLRKLGCDTPIYALTANAMSHEVDKYLALGFNGHLKKPIERKHFIATIAKYYGAHQAQSNQLDCGDSSEEKYQFKSEEQAQNQAEKVLQKVDMTDLIEQFKAGLINDKQNIINQLKKQDYTALAYDVHRIAGAAQMFGFAQLAHWTMKTENSIKAGDTEQAIHFCQNLLTEIEQILT